MQRVFLALIALGLFWGCDQIEEVDLLGDWKPLLLTQGQDSLDVDLSKTSLTFSDNAQYIYRKTAFEMVSGQYAIDYPILYLFPNTQTDTSRLQILNLENDTLTLRMNHQNNERIMKLIKQD
jgi:hypothetical protein